MVWSMARKFMVSLSHGGVLCGLGGRPSRKMDLWDPSFHSNPGLVGLHPDLHGFIKWVIDAFSVLAEFIQKVVQVERILDTRHGQIGLRKISTPTHSTGFGFFLFPLPFYLVFQPANGSVILVQPGLL